MAKKEKDKLKKNKQNKVNKVPEQPVLDEVLLPLSQLDFGKAVVTKCDIGLWRTRGEPGSLVGEFAFQVKFGRKEDVAKKAEGAVCTVLHNATAGCEGLVGARRDQEGHGLPSQGERAPKP